MTTLLSFRFRLLTVAALFAGLFTNVNAQNGITAFGSAGISDIEISGLGLLDLVDPYIKPITQYTAGIRYEKDLSPRFAFVTGAQYSSRGFGVRENFNIDLFGVDLPVDARVETRLNYLEAPATIKYSFTESGVKPYVKAGASAAYALNGKLQPKVDAILTWNLPAININLENDMYNRFDVSGIAAAGIDLPIGETGNIQFEATYRHSLNDMFLDNITNIRIKSHGLSAGVGYTMRF
jgi:hypothetical protein